MGFSDREIAFQWKTNRSDDGDVGVGLLAAEFSNRQKVTLLAADEAGATSVDIAPYGSF